MRFTALAKRNLKEMYRDPFTVILSILMPAAFLLMIWVVPQSTGEEPLSATSLVPGVAVFGFTMLFLFSSTALSRDRDSALLSRLLTTPLKSSDFILAYSLPYVIIAIIQIAVLFAVAAPLKLEISGNIGIALIPLLLMAICFIGLGMFLGSLFNEKQNGGIA
jgi:ABC-2 type transport system permease protein